MFFDAYRFELVPRNQNSGFQTLAFKARRELEPRRMARATKHATAKRNT